MKPWSVASMVYQPHQVWEGLLLWSSLSCFSAWLVSGDDCLVWLGVGRCENLEVSGVEGSTRDQRQVLRTTCEILASSSDPGEHLRIYLNQLLYAKNVNYWKVDLAAFLYKYQSEVKTYSTVMDVDLCLQLESNQTRMTILLLLKILKSFLLPVLVTCLCSSLLRYALKTCMCPRSRAT